MLKKLVDLNFAYLLKSNVKLIKNSIKCNRHLNTTCILDVKGTEIKMPVLSPTMSEGSIVKWHKNEGDPINPGDMICEIQTDKAVVAMELEEEGVLAKILINENNKNVKIGETIALMVDPGENWQEVEYEQKNESKLIDQPQSKSNEEDLQILNKNLNQYKISPSVRNLLNQHDINISDIKATGPKNIHLKSDVLNYIENRNSKTKEHQIEHKQTKIELSKSKDLKQIETKQQLYGLPDFIDIELSNMRRTIAKRLTESKTTIPHAYMTIKSNLSRLLLAIEESKKNLRTGGSYYSSFTSAVIKIAAESLTYVPKLNSIFNPKLNQIELLKSIDISVAVATKNGLITPIIFNADKLEEKEIFNRLQDLVKRAREGKLQPNEYIGGSFTISNLGMFNIHEFSAVINPPQTAILAVGSSTYETRLLDSEEKSMLTATLSYDARCIDYESAALFLENFQKNIFMEYNDEFNKPLRQLDYFAK